MTASQIVLVTGATSGIGRATALHLARRGHRVFAVGRRVAHLESLAHESQGTQLETNVFGLLAMTRAFLPAMRARRRGRVVNVSSVGGRVTLPLLGAYNAS